MKVFGGKVKFDLIKVGGVRILGKGKSLRK